MPKKSKRSKASTVNYNLDDGESHEAIAEREQAEAEAQAELDTASVMPDANEGNAAAAAAERRKHQSQITGSGAMVSHAKMKETAVGVKDIVIEKLDISYSGKTIMDNATLSLFFGHRYGIVGMNGCGKTTLMNAIGCGEIALPKQVDFYHLQHEVAASNTVTALEAVLQADNEKNLLEAELEELVGAEEDENVLHRMEEIHSRLDELDADTAESRAAQILFGLGFNQAMQESVTSSFSGGWRMRIALAQALFVNPSLLLLDEPTNHLDIEAVVWLETYLKRFKKILLMVSHSADFMDEVCTDIIHIARGKMKYYTGNYDQFTITRAETETHQAKRFVRQQASIKSMKEYIARFGHGSKKLARQAQSKEKQLVKMQRGGLETAVAKDHQVTFVFPCAGELPPPLIQCTEVDFAYPGRKPIFQNLELGLDMDSRICLVGPNGAGKTTLTKLLCRELEPTNGYVAKNAHCIIARFHQHFVDQINMDLSPIEWMSQEFPDVITKETFRTPLGRMGVSGALQTSPMRVLSDGQKSRVVLAWMAFKRPHFMILDEPTNHLDIESIDALADAINSFEGAVVVVSHDLRLIAQIADEIWICDNGKVTKFEGDIADYKAHVEKEIERMAADFVARRKAREHVNSPPEEKNNGPSNSGIQIKKNKQEEPKVEAPKALVPPPSTVATASTATPATGGSGKWVPKRLVIETQHKEAEEEERKKAEALKQKQEEEEAAKVREEAEKKRKEANLAEAKRIGGAIGTVMEICDCDAATARQCLDAVGGDEWEATDYFFSRL